MTNEHCLVWPNGEVTDHGTYSRILERWCVIRDQLQGLSVPEAYWPKMEPYTPAFPTPRDYTPQHPEAKHRAQVWAPTPYQIERVRTRQFGWSDPCVICGGHFPQCHEPWETEAFVNRVKAWLKEQR
jgi:hypothetical protein